MPAAFQINIRFLVDRYHGGEWPPEPARLFQALVASGKTGTGMKHWSDRHHGALQWLERLPPPTVAAKPAEDTKPYVLFVPNSSTYRGVVSKTSKAVQPKAIVGHEPGEIDVIYRWPLHEENAAVGGHVAALDELAARVRSLGWGVDFAAAEAALVSSDTRDLDLERFEPKTGARWPLRIPVEGTLDNIEYTYAEYVRRVSPAGVDTCVRPTKFGIVRYHREGSRAACRYVIHTLQTGDGGTVAEDWQDVQTVAAWLRHAAGEAFRNEPVDGKLVEGFIQGHTEAGQENHRLSFIPLPTVGHRHNDAGIRRVMVVEPPGVSAAEAALTEMLATKLGGAVLTDGGGRERAFLLPTTPGDFVVRCYVGKASLWRTVTPIVLHGFNSQRGKISLPKTERLLVQALALGGVCEDLIDDLAFQNAPFWPGCGAATAIRVPTHLQKWPRLHVQLRLKQPIEGPVLAGIGRHCGIGVFAATRLTAAPEVGSNDWRGPQRG